MIAMDSNITSFHFYHGFLSIKSNRLVLSYSNAIKCIDTGEENEAHFKREQFVPTEFIKYRSYRGNSAR